ncbi:PREDICTED: egl nine homolog 1-like, partial [Myotis brandtii]|uniref:egl nine homolog 1-like n=1 Tax=Myotis brandtii TaxID=109478 RepID=UPI000703F4C8
RGAEPGRRPAAHQADKPLPALKLALEHIVRCIDKHGICVWTNSCARSPGGRSAFTVVEFLCTEPGPQIGKVVRALRDTGKFTDRQLVSQKSDFSKNIRGDQIPWIERGQGARLGDHWAAHEPQGRPDPCSSVY